MFNQYLTQNKNKEKRTNKKKPKTNGMNKIYLP